jgi:hypothetical protein
LFSVGLHSAPSPQDVTSGNFLLVSCQLVVKKTDDKTVSQDNFESFRDGYCRGIIEGVADTSPNVCPIKGSTYGQDARIVVKYLQDHPEELHLANTALVEKALAKVFPCGK